MFKSNKGKKMLKGESKKKTLFAVKNVLDEHLMETTYDKIHSGVKFEHRVNYCNA